jgi:hypothetical protein
VSLDNTNDHCNLTGHDHDYWTDAVLAHPERMTAPMLFTANRYAIFEVGDHCRNANRYYFTFRYAGHSDFTSRNIRKMTLASSDRRDDRKQREFSATLTGLKQRFQSVCEYVLTFYDAYLKDDDDAKSILDALYRATPVEGNNIHVEFVPQSAAGAEAYDLESAIPPLPRQVKTILKAHGVKSYVEVLNRFAEQRLAGHPIYDYHFTLLMVAHLFDTGRDTEGLELLQAYQDVRRKLHKDEIERSEVVRWVVETGDNLFQSGRIDDAISQWQRARLLDPKDLRILGRLIQASVRRKIATGQPQR